MPLTLKNFNRQSRQPGANTVAYYPLDSTNTVNDLKGSGTAFNLTNNGSVVFGTTAGVDCATFSGSNYLEYSSYSPSGMSNFTMSCWVRFTNSSSRGFLGIGKFNTARQCMGVLRDSGSGKVMSSPYADGASTQTVAELNSWYHIVCVYSGNYKTYLNTVAGSGISATISLGNGVIRVGYAATGENKMYGQVSNVIIENKARTDQEISDYYDLTKGDYGIS